MTFTALFAAGSLTVAGVSAPGESSMLSGLGVTAVVAFLPIIVIAATSFIKISLVLAILRSALGSPGVPPTSVLTALAAVLSLFVMAPVGEEMLGAVESAEELQKKDDPLGIDTARALLTAAGEPLMEFLKLNTPDSEIDFFQDLAGEDQKEEAGFRVLLPAFATGEIVEAFVIGFLIYLPFLVIDLIVSATLLALGMHMLSPMTISLPLKLLLFVAVDGWHILLSGLLVDYV